MVIYAAEHPNARTLSIPLLELAAKQYWSLSSPLILNKGAHGKPFFQDYPHHHFNISHSGQYILCALDNVPVGIDIQIIKPRRTAFLDHLCSPQERQWLRERNDHPEAFALLWSMKESICKYSGRGLTFPISNIKIPLPHNREKDLTLDGVCYSLFHGADWYACVCSQHPWSGELIWCHNSFNQQK